MKGVLFVVFPTRAGAERARSRLIYQERWDRLRDTRLHEKAIDLLLGIDLDGTSAQLAREEDVTRRFALVFGLCVLAGLAIDLSGVIGDVGMAATMGLGSLGIVLGTLAVLFARHQPLDEALCRAEEEIEAGRFLLTIPTDEGSRPTAEHAARTFGGREIFSA